MLNYWFLTDWSHIVGSHNCQFSMLISCPLLDDIEFIMIKTYLCTYYKYKNSKIQIWKISFPKRTSSHEIIFWHPMNNFCSLPSHYFWKLLPHHQWYKKCKRMYQAYTLERLNTFDICTYEIINNLSWICKFVHFTIICV